MGKRSDISNSRRMTVYERDDFKCRYCGRSSPDIVLEIDHILPVSMGGTNDISNLVTVCSQCNNGKSDDSYKKEYKHVINQELIDNGDGMAFEINLSDEEYKKLCHVRNFIVDKSGSKNVTVGELLKRFVVKSISDLDVLVKAMEGIIDV